MGNFEQESGICFLQVEASRIFPSPREAKLDQIETEETELAQDHTAASSNR